MPASWVMHLHSNMFLLIQRSNTYLKKDRPYLHSNMFLLIPNLSQTLTTVFTEFTFQYVSINTSLLRR